METEPENPTPAYSRTFSSKSKHSAAFVYRGVFRSTCVFLGSSIKYLLRKYSGHVKVRGAKSYKELDVGEE